MKKMRFGEISAAEFDEFERASERTNIFQITARARLREKMGCKSYILGVFLGEKLVGAGILLEKGGEGWIAYGPLLDWSDKKIVSYFMEEVVDLARRKGMMRIEVFPYILVSRRAPSGEILDKYITYDVFTTMSRAGFRYEGEATTYQMKANRWSFVKDLTGIASVDELRNSYSRNIRRILRKVEGMVEVRKLERKEIGLVKEMIDDSNEKNGVAGRGLDYYEQIYDTFGAEAEFVGVFAVGDGRIVAGGMFIEHGDELVDYISGVRTEDRDLFGNVVLVDYMLRECLERGVARFNMFWIEGMFEGNKLLEFKAKFGGVVEEYVGGFERVLRPFDWFLVRIWRKIRGILRKILRK